MSIDEKAEEAEQEFRNFMDQINVPYLPISNEMGKFSAALRELLNTKRPDYLLLLGKAGMLPVDVKYKDDGRKFPSFTIDCEEVERYLNFSDAFGIDVWFAISNQQMKYATWYWLSVNDVIEKDFEKKRHPQTGKEFYIAPKRKLIKVSADSERPLQEVIHRLVLPHS